MPWITTIPAKCAADNNMPLSYKGRNTHLHSGKRENAGTIKFPARKPPNMVNWKNWKINGSKLRGRKMSVFLENDGKSKENDELCRTKIAGIAEKMGKPLAMNGKIW